MGIGQEHMKRETGRGKKKERERVRERRRGRESKKGLSSTFYGKPDLPGCCQVTGGRSLEGMPTLSTCNAGSCHLQVTLQKSFGQVFGHPEWRLQAATLKRENTALLHENLCQVNGQVRD